MTPRGAAGRAPGAKRGTPSPSQRSRAASPTRRAPRAEVEHVGRQTTLTARAAILVLAVASVMVAVAVPLKIWLGQRGDIASSSTQIHQTEAALSTLNAQNKRWQDPAYVESQARSRLHYVMPGQKTYLVLGRSAHGGPAGGTHASTGTSTDPWYSQFWDSVQAAGSTTAAK